ncbi:hypothetical protein [Robinsoniella sp. KNHs210]|nr:hypothetical protein [Robinsoniella sp. KNHs210]
MVEKLIDYILVGKKDPVTKEVPIQIHWKINLRFIKKCIGKDKASLLS